MKPKDWRLEEKRFITRAVHAGERTDLTEINPVVTPIFPSVGYTFADSAQLDAVIGGEQPGYVYSPRYANPTVAALETAVANLESAAAAIALPSGMAAIHLALLGAGMRTGSHVIVAADVYGATYSLVQGIFAELGATVHLVDVLDLAGIEDVLSGVRVTAVLVETISNPLMKVANLPRLAELAHAHNALLLVDNTFCSPYLCNPIHFGADMVIHSATKFIGGHGDVMAGIVATSAPLKEEMVRLNKLLGSSLGPFEAWLAHRGLKTLPLRMRQQCQNALKIATWLQNHPKISQVHYAFLPNHPQFELMNQLSNGKGGGAVLSFEVKNAGKPEIFALLDALQLIQPATSLGDIYSLMLYPAISSHRTLTPAERHSLGIGDGLLRLSAGIEDAADIQADLAQALDLV
ncbi:trans-sulfuration enzyme family protein [Candidatus Leptofilum sp.]|uniref:trans-sulfuration enzyme family protein n=1 Tax=Candidatus Leptofilum sp. TaxID=3241576 RepID=UPI003B5A25CB